MNEKTEYKIYVLLSRFKNKFSKFVSFVSIGGCSHASIGLSENPKRFYSFTLKKGFSVECPLRWENVANKAVCYELSVSKEQYEEVRANLQYMTKYRKEYKYSWIGVVFCFLKIPNKIKNRYICSQFVSELLVNAGIIRIPISPSICLPVTLGHFVNKSKIAKEIYNTHENSYIS